MFGYIRPFKPELKIREYEVYNSVYCGLCHTLRKRYGLPARFLLSYDATFLALLRLSLADNCSGLLKKRCIVSPLKKKTCCRITDETNFCADVSAVVFYYKLKDNLRDSGFLKKLPYALLLPVFSFIHRKASENSPEMENRVRSYIASQTEAETRKTASIDEAAEPTAKLVSYLVSCGAKNEKESRILRRFGYFLGRWVYLADAADDIRDDLKSGNYNPFAAGFQIGRFEDFFGHREKVKMLLNSCVYEMCAAYELLDRGRFDSILRNVIYLGLPDIQKKVLIGDNTKKAKI